MGASSRRDRDVCDPRLIPPLLRSVAIPHLLPWLLTAFSSAASSFQPRQLWTRFSPRAVPLLLSFTGHENRAFPHKRLRVARPEIYPGPPACPGQRSRHPSAPSLVYVGEFCGLKACVHTARESKPSRGRLGSISQETIYARTNPGGAGMHPAAGEAAPRFAGKREGKPCSPSSTARWQPRGIALPAPAGIRCLPGGGQSSG